MRRRAISGAAEMSTVIRPEIARSNAYFISKHRYYELKHFCLQYREWHADHLDSKALIRETCDRADPVLGEYIFKAVTEDRSYTYLKTKMGMPCGRSMYFDRYRRFFKLLSDARG